MGCRKTQHKFSGTPFLTVKSEKVKTGKHLSMLAGFWWERVDSDHRSETQQIYSLPPLATREHSHIKLKKKLELVDGLEPPTC